VVAFSGFYESPGPPSSGNARGIAPSHRHGYQKGLRWRCFCSLSPTFLLGIIVAKNHVMVCQEGFQGTQKGIPEFNSRGFAFCKPIFYFRAEAHL